METDSPDVADRRIELAVRETLVPFTVVFTSSSIAPKAYPIIWPLCDSCSRPLRGECGKDPETGKMYHRGCRK